MSFVVLGGAHVPDRQAQDVAVVETRVREEDLAGRVHALEQRLVLLVRALAPEADAGERTRRRQLPTRLVAHPALEELGQAHRLAEPLLQALPAEAAQHRPQLQRAEAAA